MSIAIGIPTLGQVHWTTAWSLAMGASEGAFDEFRFCAGNMYLDDARNHLVRWFLDETECDRFLSLDSDISFVAADLAQLEADIDTGFDCVSGCYYNVFDGVLKPVARLLEGQLPSDSPFMEVAGVGAGFVMFSREILQEMRAKYDEPCPWFYEPIVDGNHYGEDVGIGHRLSEMGSTTYLDLRVQVSHYKSVRLTGPSELTAPMPPVAGGGR